MDKIFRFLAPIERFFENVGRAVSFIFPKILAFGIGLFFSIVGVMALIDWIPQQWKVETFVWSWDYPIGILFLCEGIAMMMWGMLHLLLLSIGPPEEFLD